MEQWKAIPGWEGLYEVSSCGNVRSLPRKARARFKNRIYGGNLLCPFVHPTGYCGVNLKRIGFRAKTYLVHRLVLASFVGPCPPRMQGCHGDGCRSNNSLQNLRWDTAKNNHADKILHGTAQRGTHNALSMLDEAMVKAIRTWGEPDAFWVGKTGLSKHTIQAARTGNSWKHVMTPPVLRRAAPSAAWL